MREGIVLEQIFAFFYLPGGLFADLPYEFFRLQVSKPVGFPAYPRGGPIGALGIYCNLIRGDMDISIGYEQAQTGPIGADKQGAVSDVSLGVLYQVLVS